MSRSIKRFFTAVVMVFLLAVTVNAYTVVMRSGRVIAIHDEFVVTANTLTYEVSPGIQVTLQMSAIDIAATEKANNEPPGSLLKRAELVPSPVIEEQKPGARTSRQITNRDLETYRRLRQKSEAAYEERRKELGLPSLEESKRLAAAQAEFLGQLADQRRSEQREDEAYWRSRAASLRTEIVAVDAEIDYLRARLNEIPSFPATGSFTIVSSVLPFRSFGHSIGPVFRAPTFGGPRFSTLPRPGRFAGHPGTVVSPVRGGRVVLNTGRLTHKHHPFPLPGFFGFPSTTVFASPFQPHDFSYERTVLVTRLNELLAVRAGLDARWRTLEDEARRAGAMPGWLRP